VEFKADKRRNDERNADDLRYMSHIAASPQICQGARDAPLQTQSFQKDGT